MSEEYKTLLTRFSRVLGSSGVVFWHWDFPADAFEVLGGLRGVERIRPGPLPGGWSTWLGFVHREDRDQYYTRMNACLKRGEGFDLEYRLDGRDGPVPVHERGAVYLGPNNRPLAVFSLVRDVSQIVNLETRLGLARKMEAFGRLAGGVAHDFNNMLSVILGYSHLLLDDFPENDPRLTYLREIEGAARRASSLTNQLLAFTRQEIHEAQVLRFDEVLAEMGKMLRRMVGEQVQMKLEPASGANGIVRADRNQLEQMLIHLAVCARDLLPEGGFLTFKTRVTDTSASGGADAKCELLLSAECRAQVREGDDVVPGDPLPWDGELTALGTCERIIKENGGRMEIGGSPYCPDALAIFFPLARQPRQQEGGAHEEVADASNKRILFVEDDASVRTLGRVALGRAGFEVAEAENGLAGLRRCQQLAPKCFALVITDIIMPAMGGIEMASKILEISPKVPFLFLSGYHEQVKAVAEAKLQTTYGFLRKPFPVSELRAKVNEMLGR